MNAEMLMVFFVAAIFLKQNVYAFNGNRIVNGSDTPEGEFKFLPRLYSLTQGPSPENMRLQSGLCSSTIISKRHILTAAHCIHFSKQISEKTMTFLNSPVSLFFVEYSPDGKSQFDFLKSSTQTKYYFHPSYFSVHAYKHDIAIIEFPEDIDLKIPPIKLASDYIEKDGDMAIAAGYGIYKWQGSELTGTPEHPKVLQNATVPVHASCPGIPSTSICAATCERHADAGDSGGPLMFNRNGTYYQVGVLSAGVKLNDSYIITTYTRLSEECGWIEKITNGDAKCEPLPEDPNPQPSKPVALNQPKCAPVKPAQQPDEGGHLNPSDETEIPSDQTEIPSDENGVTSAPKVSQTEALKSNSNFATLNILILFFAAIFFFD